MSPFWWNIKTECLEDLKKSLFVSVLSLYYNNHSTDFGDFNKILEKHNLK
jgi:hypothetical protein